LNALCISNLDLHKGHEMHRLERCEQAVTRSMAVSDSLSLNLNVILTEALVFHAESSGTISVGLPLCCLYTVYSRGIGEVDEQAILRRMEWAQRFSLAFA